MLKLKRRQRQKMISMEKLLKLARGSKNCNKIVYKVQKIVFIDRVDKVQCTKCTTTNSAITISATLSLHQDKININIAADFVAFQVEWI